ncbi:hypothetical protein ACSBR2_042507 [Camellia fascicularis]
MVLIMRKHEELEIKKSVSGYGKLWFRRPIIGKSSSRPVCLVTLKKPKWRLTHLPILMVVKSAEVSDSTMLQREAMVLSNFHACRYIYPCFEEEIMIVSTSTRNETEYVAKNGDFGLANTEKQMMTTSKSYKLRGNI